MLTSGAGVVGGLPLGRIGTPASRRWLATRLYDKPIRSPIWRQLIPDSYRRRALSRSKFRGTIER